MGRGILRRCQCPRSVHRPCRFSVLAAPTLALQRRASEPRADTLHTPKTTQSRRHSQFGTDALRIAATLASFARVVNRKLYTICSQSACSGSHPGFAAVRGREDSCATTWRGRKVRSAMQGCTEAERWDWNGSGLTNLRYIQLSFCLSGSHVERTTCVDGPRRSGGGGTNEPGAALGGLAGQVWTSGRVGGEFRGSGVVSRHRLQSLGLEGDRHDGGFPAGGARLL